MTRVLVCGGRNYWNRKRVAEVLDAGHRKLNFSLVIQGGAGGADLLASEWAGRRGVLLTTYRADWRRLGKSAGPTRNRRMLAEGRPDIVVAFPGGRGTRSMVEIAREAGVRVVEVPSDPPLFSVRNGARPGALYAPLSTATNSTSSS